MHDFLAVCLPFALIAALCALMALPDLIGRVW